METDQPRKVALALGSGGARGYAHIGVIDEIRDRGWEIVGVAGTSMGSVIGGLYVTGTLDAYRAWVEDLNLRDVLKLLDPTIGGAGLMRAEKVMNRVRLHTGDVNIEDLPLPYTAVATDLISQKEVWFTRGDLVDAMRASIAIPSVFTPVHRDGMVLADGGLLNPVPVMALAAVRADAIIAVNLAGPSMRAEPLIVEDSAGPLSRIKLPSLPAMLEPRLASLLPRFRREADTLEDGAADRDLDADQQPTMSLRAMDVVDRSYTTLQSAVQRYRMAAYPPDVVVDVPSDVCGTMDFHRASEMIELGRTFAREAFDAWDSPGSALSSLSGEREHHDTGH